MTAKEMFKKIGFNENKHKDYIIYWKYLKLNRELQIEFDLSKKCFEVRRTGGKILSEWISVELFRAINKQAEELGWLD